MAFPIAEAQLTALFMQSIVYGIHVVTFAACMYAWFGRHPTLHASNRLPWMMVAIALFLVGTIDVCFNFYHNLVAFIFFTGPGRANGEFEDFSNWVNVMRSLWFCLQALISDATLIYRCWMVYKRQLFVLIPPLFLWIAAAVCGGMDLYYMFEFKEATTMPSARIIQPYFHAFFAASLIINVATAAMIAYRIWSMQKLSSYVFQKSWRDTGRLNLSYANRIFVESALLYTLSVVACLVTELSKTNGNYGVSDVSIELAGISFDLIIIRIWSGVSTEAEPASAGTWRVADHVSGVMSTRIDDENLMVYTIEMMTRDATEGKEEVATHESPSQDSTTPNLC